MSKTDKFLAFVRYIKKNGKFCTKEMAQLLDISDKTIQRYRAEFVNRYGVELHQYQRGCYYVKDASVLKSIDDEFDKDLELLFDFLAMVHPKFFDIFGVDRKIVENILQNKKDIYLLKEFPFEELFRCDILEDIKKAVKYNRYVDIVYQPHERYEYRDVKPIKIVYAEGNWYLAAVTKDKINDGFKFLRINFIQQVRLLPNQFKKDYRALHFLENFQTLFSAYDHPPFEVIVEVDEEVARYFRVKKFLYSQRIIKDDGNLRLSYKITNDEEILFLAKRWMPHMKIVKPAFLQEKLQKIAGDFLAKSGDAAQK